VRREKPEPAIFKLRWRFYTFVGCEACGRTIYEDHVLVADESDEDGCSVGAHFCRACVKTVARLALRAPPKQRSRNAGGQR